MRILFQGDSITDCDRNRERDTLGDGYALMAAAELGRQEPGKYEFYNRAVSGDRVVDVYARMKRDIWNLHPDYMTLLVGVNDVWHEIDFQNGVDTERYEKVYRMLLDDTRKACPNTQTVLMEPYVLPGSATRPRWEYFCSDV